MIHAAVAVLHFIYILVTVAGVAMSPFAFKFTAKKALDSTDAFYGFLWAFTSAVFGIIYTAQIIALSYFLIH